MDLWLRFANVLYFGHIHLIIGLKRHLIVELLHTVAVVIKAKIIGFREFEFDILYELYDFFIHIVYFQNFSCLLMLNNLYLLCDLDIASDEVYQSYIKRKVIRKYCCMYKLWVYKDRHLLTGAVTVNRIVLTLFIE